MCLAFASTSYAGATGAFLSFFSDVNHTMVINMTSDDLREMILMENPHADVSGVGDHTAQILGPGWNGCSYMTIFLYGNVVIEGYACKSCIWEGVTNTLSDGTQVYGWNASQIDGYHHAHLTITSNGEWFGVLIYPDGSGAETWYSPDGANWTKGEDITAD